MLIMIVHAIQMLPGLASRKIINLADIKPENPDIDKVVNLILLRI